MQISTPELHLCLIYRPNSQAGTEVTSVPKPGAKSRFRASRFETDAKIRDYGFWLPLIWIKQQFETTALNFGMCFEIWKVKAHFGSRLRELQHPQLLPQILPANWRQMVFGHWNLPCGVELCCLWCRPPPINLPIWLTLCLGSELFSHPFYLPLMFWKLCWEVLYRYMQVLLSVLPTLFYSSLLLWSGLSTALYSFLLFYLLVIY